MVSVLQEKRSGKTYNYSKYIHNVQKEEVERKNKKVSLSNKLMSRIHISPDKEEEIKEKLQKANSKLTPQDFYTQKILYPLILVVFFLLIGLFREDKTFLFLAIASSLLYFAPNLFLSQRLATARTMRRAELPSYLTPLGLLLFTYTPYQAVKKSVDYAGPFLKPYVEQLITEMEIYPGSARPFENFSKNLEIIEASSFVAALQQAFETDQSKSREIINSQIKFMRQMRTQNYLTLIEGQPMKLTKFNMIPLVGIISVVFTIVGTVMFIMFKV